MTDLMTGTVVDVVVEVAEIEIGTEVMVGIGEGELT